MAGCWRSDKLLTRTAGGLQQPSHFELPSGSMPGGEEGAEEGHPPLQLSSGLCQYLETGSQDPGPKNQGN